MHHLVACAVIAIAACGGRYPTGLVGPGRATIAASSAADVRAHEARGGVIAYLVDKGQADPHRRERAAELERRARERRLVADAEHAARLEADALAARAHVRAYLIALGAKERPPKPPPRPEVPGDPPFPGAEWIAGDWRWEDTEWLWIDGGWSDPAMLDDAGSDLGIDVGVGVGVGVAVGRDRIRDHRDAPGRPAVRDHRDGKPETIVRDHRNRKRDDFSPAVRDHRDGKPETIVRDHRDGKRDEPVVRDHRESRSESRDSGSARDSRSSRSKDDDDDDRRSRTRDHRR